MHTTNVLFSDFDIPYTFIDEPLEITYSYWDGAGHRRVIQVFPRALYTLSKYYQLVVNKIWRRVMLHLYLN